MVKVSDQKKSERVKQYFAETARKIILEEGVAAVSVRRVAADAGYAYATIYNHFDNLDELLWYARNLLIQDVAENLKSSAKLHLESIDDFKDLFHVYMAYFLARPTVYQFFYFHALDKSQKRTESFIESGEYSQQFSNTFEYLIRSGYCTPENVVSFGRTLIFISHGILTLQFSGNDELNAENAFSEFDASFDILFGNKKQEI